MAVRFKEGDRVRVIKRQVTEEDRKSNRYFDHMAGITGVVQNVYSADEVAVKMDKDRLGHIQADVHKVAVERMREKFLSAVGEEQKRQLAPEELKFEAHYMLLVRSEDLERAEGRGSQVVDRTSQEEVKPPVAKVVQQASLLGDEEEEEEEEEEKPRPEPRKPQAIVRKATSPARKPQSTARKAKPVARKAKPVARKPKPVARKPKPAARKAKPVNKKRRR